MCPWNQDGKTLRNNNLLRALPSIQFCSQTITIIQPSADRLEKSNQSANRPTVWIETTQPTGQLVGPIVWSVHCGLLCLLPTTHNIPKEMTRVAAILWISSQSHRASSSVVHSPVLPLPTLPCKTNQQTN